MLLDHFHISNKKYHIDLQVLFDYFQIIQKISYAMEMTIQVCQVCSQPDLTLRNILFPLFD